MSIFDPKQFEKSRTYKPEISNGFKIMNMDDDYDEIVIESNDGQLFSIKSNLLIKFLLTNKAKFTLNYINFSFIIDAYNSPKTYEEYFEWKEKSEKDEENQYEKEFLVAGNYYELDDGTKFLYLGERYTVSWKIKKLGDLQITKPVKKYWALITYSDESYISSNSLFDLNSPKYKKRKIIKERKGKREDTDEILEKFGYELNWLYSKEEQPSFKSLTKDDLTMKQYEPEELILLSKKLDIHSFDMFHFSDGYFIQNNVFISKDFLTSREFSRKISSGYIFDFDLNGQGKEYFDSYSYKSNDLGFNLTTKCTENQNFRLVPDNYNMLIIKE